LLLIPDSNEYIFALGAEREKTCERLIEVIAKESDSIFIRIPRFVTTEVRNNLTPEAFKEFILLIHKLTFVDEDLIVPYDSVGEYEHRGLKAADAFIAAYAEWTGADVLVSENRHFLSRQANLPFKVLTAESCLKLIKSSLRK